MPVSMDPPRDFNRVLKAFCAEVWAIEESHLLKMVEVLSLRANGQEFTHDELRARLQEKFHAPLAGADRLEKLNARIQASDGGNSADPERPWQTVGRVAILPLRGLLTPRASWMTEVCDMTSTQQFAQWVRDAQADENVDTILFDVDSPGGDAKGNAEAVAIIRANRGKKRMIAVVTGIGASAAYYVASAADELVVSPSSEVGSIGTFTVHQENTEYYKEIGVAFTVIRAGANKAVGNPYEKLGDKGKAQIQERVDAMNAQFVDDVAANRGVSSETVNANFGQGKVLMGQAAVAAGLADRVATLEQVLSEFNTRPVGGPSSKPAPTTDTTQPQETMTMADTATAPAAAPATQTTSSQQQATPVVNPTPEQRQTAPDLTAIRAAERERISELRARATVLQISEETLQAAIDNDLSVAAAADAWTKQLAAEHRPTTPKITVTQASEDKFFAAAEEALLYSAGVPSMAGKTLSAPARGLQFKTLLDIASLSLQSRNVRTDGLPPDEIAQMALSQSPGDIHIRAGDFVTRTTDFPNLMAAIANKLLLETPDEAPFTYDMWSTRLSSVPDFNPRSMLQTGQFPEFQQVMEGKEFERVLTAEEAAWIRAEKFGQEWAMTPEMIQNNALDAFSDAIIANQQAHDASVNRMHVNLLAGDGAFCWDGKALWHADHANLVSGGGAPSLEQLQKMRLVLRKQKGLSKGNARRLSYALNMIIGNTDHETPLDQVLGTVKLAQLPVPTTDASVNVFRGRLDYAIESMLDDEATSTAYYGFTKNPTAKPIVHVFMQGYERMKTRTYYDNKTNARVWQFEGRFACAVRSWKGLVKNPGA